MTTAKTLHAKRDFERSCAHERVAIKAYWGDNGQYHDVEFMDAIWEENQRITFCGVGAHYQNSVAKNKICQLSDLTQSLLVHAKLHWPEGISPKLWPFALRCAVFLLNRTQFDTNGLMAYSWFTGNNHEEDLSQVAVWGCPVYVLDCRLQSPGKHLGIYLDCSPYYVSSVALVFNPQTGYVSPQFYMTFDHKVSTSACI